VADAVTYVNDVVFQNPTVKHSATSVVAPVTAAAAIAATVSAASAAAGAGALGNYFFFMLTQPAALLARRKARYFGVAYNALSKAPIDLAVIRLVNAETGRIVQTRVTGTDGGFIFIVGAGKYRLEASRPGFVYPSTSLAGRATDATYANLYQGQVISVTGSVIAPNIPLEPLVRDERHPEIRAAAARLLFEHGIAIVSTLLAVFSVISSANIWTVGNLILQIVLIIAFERLTLRQKPKEPGKTIDKLTGKPVRAVVRLFNVEFNKLVEAMAVDAQGKFAFLVGPSRFYLTAEAPGYRTLHTQPLDFTGRTEPGVVNPTLELERGATAAPTPSVPYVQPHMPPFAPTA